MDKVNDPLGADTKSASFPLPGLHEKAKENFEGKPSGYCITSEPGGMAERF